MIQQTIPLVIHHPPTAVFSETTRIDSLFIPQRGHKINVQGEIFTVIDVIWKQQAPYGLIPEIFTE